MHLGFLLRTKLEIKLRNGKHRTDFFDAILLLFLYRAARRVVGRRGMGIYNVKCNNTLHCERRANGGIVEKYIL